MSDSLQASSPAEAAIGAAFEPTDPPVIVAGLSQLLPSARAVVLVPWRDNAPVGSDGCTWVRDGYEESAALPVGELMRERLRTAGAFGYLEMAAPSNGSEAWSVWAEPVRIGPGSPVGALGVARKASERWADSDVSTIRVFAALCGSAWARASAEYQGSLDELVISVADRLMIASAATYSEALTEILTQLAEFLRADVAFIRKNDRGADASVLVAEYPPRDTIPDPDPLAVVPFDSDPIFAALRDLKEPLLVRKSESPDEYNDRVKDGSGIADFSGVAMPILKGGVTDGSLGFLQFYDAHWTQPQINALQAVATMLVQLDARIDAEVRLQHLALHDDLTGLPNRRALIEELERRLSTGRTPTALLFLDLDRFKYMNDYLGHLAGDRVLITTADRIRMSVRPGDFTARLGGDEFMVVMSGAGGELACMATANRLLSLVSKPLEVSSQHVSHTASVGIAIAHPGDMTALQLLGNADVALFAAKTEGRNRAVMFDDVLRLAIDERTDTEMMLRDALAHGGLRLFYQPEIDMTTGKILGVEALVRCEHPERGIIPAGQFITVAEETGLVVDLGRWVLEEACRQMQVWRDRYPGLDLLMRVNMSPAQLSSPGITEHISRCLRQSSLLGSAICLEITEHVVMQDVERAIAILDEFRTLGVRLALDDFGTGFSSMAQLKRIPIDTLKIDMSFVIGLANEPADQAIVEAIVHLGESFGLDLVAEGVENHEDMAELIRLGCVRAQGFLLAKPMPPSELDPLLWRGGIDLARI
ncbi:MAG: putative bifunctional diguanylate cyclase/phosphodiesterase [Acidimicrobiales bacterium]